MKNLTFFFFFAFFMLFPSAKSNAFAVEKILFSPVDSCSEVTLNTGEVVKVKIVSLRKDEIIYQDCGAAQDATAYVIAMSSIRNLKVHGSPEEIKRLQEELKNGKKNTEDIRTGSQKSTIKELLPQNGNKINYWAWVSFGTLLISFVLRRLGLPFLPTGMTLLSFITAIIGLVDSSGEKTGDSEKLSIAMVVISFIVLVFSLLTLLFF